MPTSIPLPIITNVYRVTLNWTESGSGQHAANVMHFLRAAGTTADVFNDLNAHVTTNMWYSTVLTAKVGTVDIIKLDGSSATVSFPAGTAIWTGQASAVDWAPQAAYIVKATTGVRGRSNRGRVYLPFVAENQTTAGILAAGAITALNAAWLAFHNAMTTAVDFPVIASYDRAHAGAGAHSTIINAYAAESVMATQRRRQGRLR